jgi:heptosyltransferase-2
MISNDSGPLYIASLMGKPTFTIYGPTNPLFHLPLGSKHNYIRHLISCSPAETEKYCFTNAGRDGCPSFECMNQLKVDEVYENWKLLLKI